MKAPILLLSKKLFPGQNKIYCLLLMLYFLCSTFKTTAQENRNKISLEIIRGAAKVFRRSIRSNYALILTATAIKIGDTIETVKDSKARIKYSDGTTFKVKPLTRIKLVPGGLNLKYGNIWFKVFKSGKFFKIQTPTMVVGIKGTAFDISASEGGESSVVKVYEGMVSVTPEYDKSKVTIVKSGMAATVKKDSTIVNLHKFYYNFAAKEWRNRIWKPSKKSPHLKAYESYIRLKRDPETKNLAATAYKIYKKLKREKGFLKKQKTPEGKNKGDTPVVEWNWR
ncbi:FecR domain-containing protein [Candidatus Riflebacteria bacterium]